MTSKPAKPVRKIPFPAPRFDIHQEARAEANHATSGILEVAAHNSSRRLPIQNLRTGQKLGPRGWPEI